MSYSMGVILIARDFTDEHDELLTMLDLAPVDAVGQIRLDDAIRRSFKHTAAAAYGGVTIVVNQFLPYDCSFEAGEQYWLDGRLMTLSKTAPVLCFFLDGISGTYGFAKFEGGRKIRCRAVDPRKLLIDEGELLPAEKEMALDEYDEQERIFTISEEFMGIRLDRLIASGDLLLTEFRSTGR